MIFGTSMMKSNLGNVQRLIPERPAYVPETAVYRSIGRVWIDVQPVADGAVNRFQCVIYNSDTAAQSFQGQLFSNPEIDGSGVFALEGAPTDLDRVRSQIKFYDGMDIYLKDGRTLTPDYSYSAN
ncbi:MAG TPA: hypothetical protein VLB27_10130 [candidate division Zixibacteria bacterium]|nr:hypothetical protein [candidate division Zixibacteria bacterium]